MKWRKQIANQYLAGSGLEFGALNSPLPVEDNCQVAYVDKYPKPQLLKLFPELKSISESIVETDILFDINQLTWSTLPEGQDFLIANHVIEHLVNPLQFLENCLGLLKRGGYLYLAVPCAEYTFDCDRQPTSWEHLYQEYQEQCKTLSNAHIDDFALNITYDHINDPQRKKRLYEDYRNPFKRPFLRNLHRQRSIHVHVWSQTSYDNFLKQAQELFDFSLVESMSSSETEFEMVSLLQKA